MFHTFSYTLDYCILLYTTSITKTLCVCWHPRNSLRILAPQKLPALISGHLQAPQRKRPPRCLESWHPQCFMKPFWWCPNKLHTSSEVVSGRYECYISMQITHPRQLGWRERGKQRVFTAMRLQAVAPCPHHGFLCTKKSFQKFGCKIIVNSQQSSKYSGLSYLKIIPNVWVTAKIIPNVF